MVLEYPVFTIRSANLSFSWMDGKEFPIWNKVQSNFIIVSISPTLVHLEKDVEQDPRRFRRAKETQFCLPRGSHALVKRVKNYTRTSLESRESILSLSKQQGRVRRMSMIADLRFSVLFSGLLTKL